MLQVPDERPSKKVLYGQLPEGKRSKCDKKKRYKDTLKASLKDFNIPTESCEQTAQDRTKWQREGAALLEATKYCEAEIKAKCEMTQNQIHW